MNAPDQPGQPADERLRAAAEARRQAAPDFALHPATRRMLVDEARRHHVRQAPRQGGPWRVRWIWGLASALALVVTLLVLRPAADFIRASRMAKSAPAPAAGPERSEPADVQLRLAKEAPPATAAAASTLRELAADAAAVPPPGPAANPAPAPADTALFLGAPLAVTTPAAGQRFQQVRAAGPPARRPATPGVLERFTLQTTGNAILLTEADGSVYRGELLAAPAAGGRDRPAAPLDNEAGQLAFRAVGTNLTLRLPVTVTGVVAVARPAVARTTTGSRAPGESAASIAPVYLSLRGTAVIGGTNRVEILAAPPREGTPPAE